jgi:DNA-binding response OmpR family regulator
VSLPDQPTQRQERPIRILSASLDPGLNHTRGLLLRYHGFDVTTSESKDNAREQIERRVFDVLIFGSTLPSDTCWELAHAFRERNAAGRIIEIIPSPWAALKNRPDATVVSTEEPSKLVATIRADISYSRKSEPSDRWQQLCEQAAVEQDPKKLLELTDEINRLLKEKEEQLDTERSDSASSKED